MSALMTSCLHHHHDMPIEPRNTCMVCTSGFALQHIKKRALFKDTSSDACTGLALPRGTCRLTAHRPPRCSDDAGCSNAACRGWPTAGQHTQPRRCAQHQFPTLMKGTRSQHGSCRRAAGAGARSLLRQTPAPASGSVKRFRHNFVRFISINGCITCHARMHSSAAVRMQSRARRSIGRRLVTQLALRIKAACSTTLSGEADVKCRDWKTNPDPKA